MTDLRPDIEAAAALLPVKLGAGRELRKLPEHLWEGEHVEMLVVGSYGGGQGLLALTDRRLLFVKEGLIGSKSEDFPLSKISSIQLNKGLLLGKITIFTSGNKADIDNVDKARGQALVDKVRNLISSATPAIPSVATGLSPIEQLEKLAALHSSGILTAEEFEEKKKVLLQQM